MPHFNIEKGVKLEEHKRTKGVSKNQDIIDMLFELEVDDSFTLPFARRSSYESVCGMLKKQGRTKGRRWVSRKDDSVTLRVWRVE
jgi:hypothetical protein